MDYQNQSLLPAMLIVIVPIILTSIGAMIISRKIIKSPLLLDLELRGLSSVTSITGGLFGLLLGLIVVSLWQDYKKIQDKIIEEASTIAVMHAESEQLAQSDTLQLLIENYLDAIINDGWPKLTEGKDSKITGEALTRLGLYTMNIKVGDNGAEYVKRDLMDRLITLSMLRKERLYYSSTQMVPFGMWVVLVIGATITVSLSFLFPVKELKTQIIITAMYSCMIGILIFLISSLNYPFRGAISIKSDAYEKTQGSFERLKRVKEEGKKGINSIGPNSNDMNK